VAVGKLPDLAVFGNDYPMDIIRARLKVAAALSQELRHGKAHD
jgi:hypothetical protein